MKPYITFIFIFTIFFIVSCHVQKPDEQVPQNSQAKSNTQSTAPQNGDAEDLPEYIRNQVNSNTLGPGDILQIKVRNQQDLSGKYEVFSDGSIRFPLIGSMSVEALDPNQVAEIIRSKLAEGFLVKPQVSIFVEVRNSKKIFVFGQVKKPGTFIYEENMTVIQAITLAGGFTERAAKDDTSVTRVVQGKRKRMPVPIDKIGKGTVSNFILIPGDIVYIPDSIF